MNSKKSTTVETAEAKPDCAPRTCSATVELQFMVVPELLATLAYVPDPVRCKIIDAEAIFLTGILGESGRKLVKAGIEFYFTRPLAEKLISKGIAVESPNDQDEGSLADGNQSPQK